MLFMLCFVFQFLIQVDRRPLHNEFQVVSDSEEFESPSAPVGSPKLTENRDKPLGEHDTRVSFEDETEELTVQMREKATMGTAYNAIDDLRDLHNASDNIPKAEVCCNS